jgi:hypothetical protein
MIGSYPLRWPVGWPKTTNRTPARFNKQDHSAGYATKRALTIAEGMRRVADELERMNARDVVISTNAPLNRISGLPSSSTPNPADPGAAVYWRSALAGRELVMAIDSYTRLADNLAAIAATLSAMRMIERHGGARILERAFTGFAALPSPSHKKGWREVLGDHADRESMERAYRELARTAHSDRGGDDARMSALNVAREEARRELGA